MSLICFRGRTILPPLIDDNDRRIISSYKQSYPSKRKHADVRVSEKCQKTFHCCESCAADDTVRQEEDNTLLSLPTCEALAYLLPGIDKKVTKCRSMLSATGKTNCTDTKEHDKYIKEKVQIGSLTNNSGMDSDMHEHLLLRPSDELAKGSSSDIGLIRKEKGLVKGKPVTELHQTDSQIINGVIRTEDNSISEKGDATTSLSLSYASSQLSEDDIQPDADFELEYDHYIDSESIAQIKPEHGSGGVIHSSSSGDTSRTFNVHSSQKIGILNAAGQDSSTYLEDYLQLLTSRNHFSPVPSSKQVGESFSSYDVKSLEYRRSSVPTLQPKDEGQGKTRQRNLSGSSDKTFLRSLGSKYLDNYLVNLTDYSWIIYPTDAKTSPSSPKAASDRAALSSASYPIKNQGVNNSDNLRRKLHFLDPEQFFQNCSKQPSLATCNSVSTVASNSPFDKECESRMTNTTDNATSPDISSSIFDKENDDSCYVSMEQSGIQKSRETGVMKNSDSPKSDESLPEDTQEWQDSEKITHSEHSNSSYGVTSLSVDVENNVTNISVEERASNTASVSNEFGVCGVVFSSKTLVANYTHPENSDRFNSKDSKSQVDKSSVLKAQEISNVTLKLLPTFSVGGKHRLESKIEEESSSSSEVSSATEPSTIVMAGDNRSLVTSDLEPSSLSSDLGKSQQDSEISMSDNFLKNAIISTNDVDPDQYHLTQLSKDGNSSNGTLFQHDNIPVYDRPASSESELMREDSLVDSTDSAGSLNEKQINKTQSPNEQKLSFLVEMLKVKQQKEVDELKQRHDLELQQLLLQLQQLSESQVSMINSAYNSPNNNSLNELLNFTASSQNISENYSSDTAVSESALQESVATNTPDTVTSSIFPSSNHTDGTPSFFLHENRQESGERSEVEHSKISRIFSSSRARFQCIPQSITEILAHHPNFVESNSSNLTKESYDSQGRPVVPKSEPRMESGGTKMQREFHEHSEQPDSYSKRIIEAGLDLVPARESDLASMHQKKINSKHLIGIIKLQAIVRGRRIRKMMATSQMQQLLSTLKEVAKLAHQFHRDILTDNIRKGDVGFHRALFHQEQQAREKLHHLVVELSPSDQIKLIEKDKVSHQNESQRKLLPSKIVPPSSSHAQSINSRSRHLVHPTHHFSAKPCAIPSPHRGRTMKQITGRVASEPPRPCRANLSSDPSPRKQSLSPRDRQLSSFPALKSSAIPKGIPKLKLCNAKKQDTKVSSIGSKSPNSHLCRSEAAIKMNGSVKSSPRGGENLHARKPWR